MELRVDPCDFSDSLVQKSGLRTADLGFGLRLVNKYFLSAVLITGGTVYNGSDEDDRPISDDVNTSEMYLPSSGHSCKLPDLIITSKQEHTQDNLLLCGGVQCQMWSPMSSTWNESVSLNPRRLSHVSWSPGPDIGTFLIGGVGKLASKKVPSRPHSTTFSSWVT